MRLLLVRHGETDWNAARRIQGTTDVPLNDTGRKQAYRLHRRLSDVPLDAVYTSDLRRCVETARIAVGSHRLRSGRRNGVRHRFRFPPAFPQHRNAPIRSAPALREIRYGRWEGATRAELEAAGYGHVLAAWTAGSPCAPPEGGETREEADARMDHFLSSIFPRHADETVLVVSHGGPLRLLVARLLGEPVRGWGRIRLANASLTEVVVKPGGAVRFARINDVSHLA